MELTILDKDHKKVMIIDDDGTIIDLEKEVEQERKEEDFSDDLLLYRPDKFLRIPDSQ